MLYGQRRTFVSCEYARRDVSHCVVVKSPSEDFEYARKDLDVSPRFFEFTKPPK